ncbi:MAG: hypothetical protein WA210_15700 [Burkholderiaceae bacterium]
MDKHHTSQRRESTFVPQGSDASLDAAQDDIFRRPHAFAAPRKPHRLWMTESFAVVMAALSPARERRAAKRVFRQSPYSVGETMLRIEAAALNHGLSVVVEWNGSQPVIVLGSSIGGTPVLMQSADSWPDVPLSVGVRECSDGAVEVLLANAAQGDDTDWDDLPAAVADDIAALPKWLGVALA